MSNSLSKKRKQVVSDVKNMMDAYELDEKLVELLRRKDELNKDSEAINKQTIEDLTKELEKKNQEIVSLMDAFSSREKAHQNELDENYEDFKKLLEEKDEYISRLQAKIRKTNCKLVCVCGRC